MKHMLLIASGNPGKIREIKMLLGDVDTEIISAHQKNMDLTVEETGNSYAENARLKAMAYLKETGIPVLADDSGLEVDALNGEPGIYSARYSPNPEASDSDRYHYLLEQLAGKPQPWTAHFHCTAILALPDGEVIETTGRCDGIIIPEARGAGGFGYDPIFYLPEFGATMAELPMRIKNKISHRARAVSALVPVIKEKLN